MTAETLQKAAEAAGVGPEDPSAGGLIPKTAPDEVGSVHSDVQSPMGDHQGCYSVVSQIGESLCVWVYVQLIVGPHLPMNQLKKKPKHCLTPGFLIVTDTSGTTKRFPVHKISNLTLQFTFKISIAANDRVCHGPSGPAEAAAGARPAGQVHQPVEHREELHRDELYKYRSSGKSILGDYFQGNRTSRRDLFSY